MSKWSMNEFQTKATHTFHVGTDQSKIFLKEVGVGFDPVKHSTFPFER